MKKPNVYIASPVFYQIADNPHISAHLCQKIKTQWAKLNESCNLIVSETRFPTDDEILQDLGFELRELNSKEINEYGSQGILVVSVTVGGKMNEINVEPGYIITKVNGTPVSKVNDFIGIASFEPDEPYDVWSAHLMGILNIAFAITIWRASSDPVKYKIVIDMILMVSVAVLSSNPTRFNRHN